MLSIARNKEIRSLNQKKYRQRYGQFLVEGEKSVLELCQSQYTVSEILVTEEIFSKVGHRLVSGKVHIMRDKDIQRLGTLSNSPGILAVSNFQERQLKSMDTDKGFSLVLDGITDPGNFGTLLRIADWFGIQSVICSKDTVDLYNPKSISASMGSFTRVNVFYEDLKEVLNNSDLPSFACTMNGKRLNEVAKVPNGFVIIGNEANGIRKEVEGLANTKITIQRIGGAESLNAAIAAGIVCHHFLT